MLHQATVGLVKANTGERREHAQTPRSPPPPPPTPLACFPAPVLRQPSHSIIVMPTVSGNERFVLRAGETGRKRHEEREEFGGLGLGRKLSSPPSADWLTEVC